MDGIGCLFCIWTSIGNLAIREFVSALYDGDPFRGRTYSVESLTVTRNSAPLHRISGTYIA